MNMVSFLNEIDHAISKLMPVIWEEHRRLIELNAEIPKLMPAVEQGYRRAQDLGSNPGLPDDENLATTAQWETYFGPDRQQNVLRQERQALEAQIDAHSFSTSALSGALLQYAKQAISLVHGSIAPCPSGRAIGSQDLKTIIWQGRNQAIHWEDSSLSTATEQCFAAMSRDFDPKFADHGKRSLAMDVIDLLGWRGVEKFREDLLSLG